MLGKRLPEIESHLRKVQKGLDALEMEAKAMESKVKGISRFYFSLLCMLTMVATIVT